MRKLGRRKFTKTLAAAAVFLATCRNTEEFLDMPTTPPKIEGPFVVSSVNGQIPSDQDKEVKLGDSVDLYAILPSRDNIGNTIYFSESPLFTVHSKLVDPSNVRRWKDSFGRINIEWKTIESGNLAYNALSGSNNVKYSEAHRDFGWTLPNAADDVGTHRYIIKANYKLGQVNTETHLGKNLVYGAHRLSLREGDDLAGWMTAWSRLPYIYGSSSEEVDNYIGGDCADIITGALRKMGYKIGDTYSQGFRRYGDIIFNGHINSAGQFVDNRGKPVKIKIQRNDLLIFKKPQKHVAVFYKDVDTAQHYDIEVINTHDARGVIKETFYAHEHSLPFRDIFYFGNRPEKKLPIIDTVEIIRLNPKLL